MDDERPICRIGCTLKKYSPERVVAGARENGYCGDDCSRCGWNDRVRDRRRKMLRLGALERGSDGLKRLYLGEEDNTSSGADAPPSPQGEGFEKEEML